MLTLRTASTIRYAHQLGTDNLTNDDTRCTKDKFIAAVSDTGTTNRCKRAEVCSIRAEPLFSAPIVVNST